MTLENFGLTVMILAIIAYVLWLVWITKVILAARRDYKAIAIADRLARSSRINSITSTSLSGPIARNQQGQPIRVAKERQLLKFEMRGGENDSDSSGGRL